MGFYLNKVEICAFNWQLVCFFNKSKSTCQFLKRKSSLTNLKKKKRRRRKKLQKKKRVAKKKKMMMMMTMMKRKKKKNKSAVFVAVTVGQVQGFRAERLFNVPLLHTEGTCVTGDHPLQLGRHFRNISY